MRMKRLVAAALLSGGLLGVPSVANATTSSEPGTMHPMIWALVGYTSTYDHCMKWGYDGLNDGTWRAFDCHEDTGPMHRWELWADYPT